jgi:hypothetical protein
MDWPAEQLGEKVEAGRQPKRFENALHIRAEGFLRFVMKGRTCDMISLTVFVPGRGIGLCAGLVTELFVSATTYWYLAACMQMRSHSKRAREIETYICNLTKFVVDGGEIGGSDAGDIGRLGGGECCRIGDEDLSLSSSQVSIFLAKGGYPCKGRLSLQRDVIGRLGKEGEGERTRGDTLGRTPCLEHQDREVERMSVHAEAVCTAWISF